METKLKTLTKLDDYPPFLCYALTLARNVSRRIPLTLDVLVKASGLPERTFIRISQKTTWDGVKVGVMRAFLKSCRVDPWNMKHYLKLLRRYQNQRLPGLNNRQWRTLNDRCKVLAGN